MLVPLLKRMAPGMDAKAMLAELRERIAEELDYEIEAQNQRQVARAFRGHPFVRVPAVDTRLSTRRVLVTEFVEGRAFDEVKKLPRPSATASPRSRSASSTGCSSASSIAAGDPHPGNYLLCADGRVCFLDFGLVRRVDAGLPRRASRRWRARSIGGRRRRGPRLAGDARLPPGPRRLRPRAHPRPARRRPASGTSRPASGGSTRSTCAARWRSPARRARSTSTTCAGRRCRRRRC